ncbi:hypothetical protein [Polluticoccus soli]|nr:hypothetical protein [Flavipsychrobacter sp. JY13-12]
MPAILHYIMKKNTKNGEQKLTTERSELVSTLKKDIQKLTNWEQNSSPA